MFLHQANDNDLPALPATGSKARRLALLLISIVPLLIGALALFLGQDTNWDFRNYHWYNAYALLNERHGFDLLPSQTPYFYNPALDLPFFFLATHFSAKFSGFILATFQGLNFVLIFMLSHATLRISNPKKKVWVCAFLALLGMMGGGGIAQIGTTFYDNITSLGLFISALLVIHYFETLLHGTWGRSFLVAVIAGFPAGLMMGLKLPFVVFCIGLCGALFLTAGPLKRRIWITFGFGIGIILGLTLAMGPWAYFLHTNFGSPLFPYFNNVFQSPLAPINSGRDVQFLPTTLFDRLFFPFVFTATPYRVGEIPWRDLRIPILYLLLPLSVGLRLVFGRNKNAHDRLTTYFAARYLLWLAAITYVVWIFLFAIYRYLIPLEMLAPLLIVVAMGMLPVRSATRGLLTTFVFVSIILTIQPGDWGRKKPWIEKAVMVTHPKDMTYASDLMILMAGFDPYSHVISEFPPHIPFVRIQSNFTSPEENKGINDLIKMRVLRHRGSFKLLMPKGQLFHAEKALKHFGLTFLPQSCQPVVDHIFDTKLELCDVQRTKKNGAP